MAGQQPDLPSPRPATGRIQTSAPRSPSRGSGGFPWVSPTPGRAQSCPRQLPGSPPLQDTKAAPVQVQAGGDTALGPGSGPGAFWSQDGGDGLHPPLPSEGMGAAPAGPPRLPPVQCSHTRDGSPLCPLTPPPPSPRQGPQAWDGVVTGCNPPSALSSPTSSQAYTALHISVY